MWVRVLSRWAETLPGSSLGRRRRRRRRRRRQATIFTPCIATGIIQQHHPPIAVINSWYQCQTEREIFTLHQERDGRLGQQKRKIDIIIPSVPSSSHLQRLSQMLLELSICISVKLTTWKYCNVMWSVWNLEGLVAEISLWLKRRKEKEQRALRQQEFWNLHTIFMKMAIDSGH